MHLTDRDHFAAEQTGFGGLTFPPPGDRIPAPISIGTNPNTVM